MEIRVFGPGCAKCKETERLVEDVVREMHLEVTVEKVRDFKAMMAAGVMSTPAIAVDGNVVCTGRVPDKSEVMRWIQGDGAGKAGGSCSCSGSDRC